jgi:hypothetical protein
VSDLPEEAIEAAAKAEYDWINDGLHRWEDACGISRADFLDASARGLAAALPFIREQIWAEARTVLERQTDLTELIHFDRPSDFRKGILTCLAALDAARVARGSTPEQENPK